MDDAGERKIAGGICLWTRYRAGLDWEYGQSIVIGGKADGQLGVRRGQVLEYKEEKSPGVI